MRSWDMQRARDAFARSQGAFLVTIIGAALLVGPLSCAEAEDELIRDRRGEPDDDGAKLGSLGCNPLAASCPPGEACHDVGGDPRFACVPVDLEARPAGYGEPCTAGPDCQAGLTCSPREVVIGCKDAGFGCCAQFCDLDEAVDPCPGSSVCLPYFSAPPPGGESLGVCG